MTGVWSVPVFDWHTPRFVRIEGLCDAARVCSTSVLAFCHFFLVKQWCEHCWNTRDILYILSLHTSPHLCSTRGLPKLTFSVCQVPTLWHRPLCSDMGSSCRIIILRCYCTPTEQIFNTLRAVLHRLCCWLYERLGQTRRRTYHPNVLLSPACTSVRGLASTGNPNFYKKNRISWNSLF